VLRISIGGASPSRFPPGVDLEAARESFITRTDADPMKVRRNDAAPVG